MALCNLLQLTFDRKVVCDIRIPGITLCVAGPASAVVVVGWVQVQSKGGGICLRYAYSRVQSLYTNENCGHKMMNNTHDSS